MIFYQIRGVLQFRLKDILLIIVLTYLALFFTVPNIVSDYKVSSNVIVNDRGTEALMASDNLRLSATGYLLAYIVTQVDTVKSPTVDFRTEVLCKSAASALIHTAAVIGTLFILSADHTSRHPQYLSGRQSFLDLLSYYKQQCDRGYLIAQHFPFSKILG